MTLDDDARRAFEAVTTGYYRDPQPAQAALALRVTCALLDVTPDEGLKRFATLVYLLGRIARTSASAEAALAPIATAYRGPHAPVIARIVPDDGPFPDALTLTIDDPTHLDLLWAEFFATGTRARWPRSASRSIWTRGRSARTGISICGRGAPPRPARRCSRRWICRTPT